MSKELVIERLQKEPYDLFSYAPEKILLRNKGEEKPCYGVTLNKTDILTQLNKFLNLPEYLRETASLVWQLSKMKVDFRDSAEQLWASDYFKGAVWEIEHPFGNRYFYLKTTLSTYPILSDFPDEWVPFAYGSGRYLHKGTSIRISSAQSFKDFINRFEPSFVCSRREWVEGSTDTQNTYYIHNKIEKKLKVQVANQTNFEIKRQQELNQAYENLKQARSNRIQSQQILAEAEAKLSLLENLPNLTFIEDMEE